MHQGSFELCSGAVDGETGCESEDGGLNNFTGIAIVLFGATAIWLGYEQTFEPTPERVVGTGRTRTTHRNCFRTRPSKLGMDEQTARREIVAVGQLLYERSYVVSSDGNISVR